MRFISELESSAPGPAVGVGGGESGPSEPSLTVRRGADAAFVKLVLFSSDDDDVMARACGRGRCGYAVLRMAVR